MTGDRRHLRVVSSQPGLQRGDTRHLICTLAEHHDFDLEELDVIGITDIAEDHPATAIEEAFATWCDRNPGIPPTVIGIDQLLNPIDVSTIVKEIKRNMPRPTLPTEDEQP